MLRLPANSTPEELKIFLHQPTRYYKTHPAPGASVQFTEREKKVIQLISNGEAVASIGRSLNLHIKTIYQIRLNLIKKLGCSGRTDFLISAAAKRSNPGARFTCNPALKP
ncbi:LuxR family transcriptional regulator [Klebsiella pneumoniae]|nr:LuxR family transcriptional regulator [Klebsiella pneumoniae]